jgi:FkbH-like protein
MSPSDEGESSDLLARFHTNGSALFPELHAWLKARLKQGERDAVASLLPRLIVPELDYTGAINLHRILGALRKGAGTREQRLKVAVLGGFTTKQLVTMLDLFLAAQRVRLDVYEADFGTLRQEVLDPDSGLYRFAPDVVWMPVTWRDIGQRPGLGDTRESVDRKVAQEVAEWRNLWSTAHARLRCQILQCNFAAPPWRVMSNLDGRHAAGFGHYVARLNQALQDGAPAFVTIHDVDHLAATWGRERWHDERFWFQAKMPCAPECLVDYAHSIASLLHAQLGKTRKCLVLDLDNTLWGGVIGDDGLGGIRLGQGEPEAEAFVAFQQYVKALRERGVILAVCSKNTESIAKEPFESHTEMQLRLTDIACFVANWDDKATNLRRIAQRLNIGVDSLVFVDDNPVERDIVRRLCPEVAVPEMPADPALFVRALDRQRYFQSVAISSEDLRRTELYQAEGERQALESTAADLDSFLRSLSLTARVEPVTSTNLERSAQLINRSNQFNLTTRRYSAGDVLGMLSDPSRVTRTFTLKDRFGDHGLISVVLAFARDGVLEIETWVMSCRVLKRGVEAFVLNALVRVARERGLSAITGEYIPTAKNGLVKDLYAALGFTQQSAGQGGTTVWRLPLDADWQPHPHFISEEA